eukprot:CAMPEP_0116569306 /NCGR_PEP_ID=MMETSP0397-20121206/16229_1 /TAXON_ID=216820 /ORGANISM="Cyclophora tenuis, Strain ECT3854" /LENGTH=46 /DNA_ID= /DNA_START= /DNA_END= /DNA_ORIENTATION=
MTWPYVDTEFNQQEESSPVSLSSGIKSFNLSSSSHQRMTSSAATES